MPYSKVGLLAVPVLQPYGGGGRAHAACPLIFVDLSVVSMSMVFFIKQNFVQLTIGLMGFLSQMPPEKRLLALYIFHFLRTLSANIFIFLHFNFFRVQRSHGGTARPPPFPKFLDPPLTTTKKTLALTPPIELSHRPNSHPHVQGNWHVCTGCRTSCPGTVQRL